MRSRKLLLRQIDSLIAELDAMTAEFIRDGLPEIFKEGSEEAIRELRKIKGFGEIDESYIGLHREAMQALADDASFKFANALEGVRRSARSLVSEAQKQKIINQLLVAEVEGAARPSDRVKSVFEEAGITAIKTPTRTINLEDYASTLTHTILADAHNTGAMTRYLSNGVQYVEVIERGTAPDLTCRFMRGKIVYLGDRRLLPPYHPNCFGGIKPYFGEPGNPLMTPEDSRIPAEAKKLMLRKA